jgi:hypothetical protein
MNTRKLPRNGSYTEPHFQRSIAPDSDNVATKIDQLLARVAGIRRGSECSRPVRFDQRGERHAREVAQRDAAVHPRPEHDQPIS